MSFFFWVSCTELEWSLVEIHFTGTVYFSVLFKDLKITHTEILITLVTVVVATTTRMFHCFWIWTWLQRRTLYKRLTSCPTTGLFLSRTNSLNSVKILPRKLLVYWSLNCYFVKSQDLRRTEYAVWLCNDNHRVMWHSL